ncbi:MAG: epoxide hydrolase [Alphaproteobacteria bacterium]|nr:epoxide hydrolase [Alphaproteobacteria bacterium]
MSTSIGSPRPFRIAVPTPAVVDLRNRLAGTRWPDEVNDDAWSYGAALPFMRELADYWRKRFDWRAVEARLNDLPQFTLKIDDTKIHFVHARGKGPKPLPLVISHGWPGSFVEMERIIPLLTDPAAHGGDPADAFDVVVPSLPGFGFSDRPTAPGCGPKAIAGMWQQLMTALGYDRFGVQGGDWGSAISIWLARSHPERVIGAHLNFMISSLQPAEGAPLTEAERAYVASAVKWRDSEGGYFSIQSTKPQTLGYGLTDSPVALAAWIAEKFRTWSDCNGDIATAIPIDDLLANIAVYWFTGNITSSLRIYKENKAAPLHFAPGERVQPPVGFAHFPKEILHPPRSYVERVFDIQRWTEMPKGGHFAAMEQPDLLAEEIRAFFRPLR